MDSTRTMFYKMPKFRKVGIKVVNQVKQVYISVSLPWLERNPRAQVHKGFAQQYNSVREDLWEIVKVSLIIVLIHK